MHNTLYWEKFAHACGRIGADPVQLLSCMGYLPAPGEKQASEAELLSDGAAYMHGFTLKCAELGADPDALIKQSQVLAGLWNKHVGGQGNWFGRQWEGLKGGLKGFWNQGASGWGTGRQQGMQDYAAENAAQRQLGEAQLANSGQQWKGRMQNLVRPIGQAAAFWKGTWQGGNQAGVKAMDTYNQGVDKNLAGNPQGVAAAQAAYDKARNRGGAAPAAPATPAAQPGNGSQFDYGGEMQAGQGGASTPPMQPAGLSGFNPTDPGGEMQAGQGVAQPAPQSPASPAAPTPQPPSIFGKPLTPGYNGRTPAVPRRAPVENLPSLYPNRWPNQGNNGVPNMATSTGLNMPSGAQWSFALPRNGIR